VPFPPACAYQNYINHVIEGQEKENRPVNKKKTYNDITIHKNGKLYSLPDVPFQLDFRPYAKK
jgi:hypothetical protein